MQLIFDLCDLLAAVATVLMSYSVLCHIEDDGGLSEKQRRDGYVSTGIIALLIIMAIAT